MDWRQIKELLMVLVLLLELLELWVDERSDRKEVVLNERNAGVEGLGDGKGRDDGWSTFPS